MGCPSDLEHCELVHLETFLRYHSLVPSLGQHIRLGLHRHYCATRVAHAYKKNLIKNKRLEGIVFFAQHRLCSDLDARQNVYGTHDRWSSPTSQAASRLAALRMTASSPGRRRRRSSPSRSSLSRATLTSTRSRATGWAACPGGPGPWPSSAWGHTLVSDRTLAPLSPWVMGLSSSSWLGVGACSSTKLMLPDLYQTTRSTKNAHSMMAPVVPW